MAKNKYFTDPEPVQEVVQEAEAFTEREQVVEVESPVEAEQPCDCDLSQSEIEAVKRLQGFPTDPEQDFDYEKFARLKLAVIVPEGVMRGSGWTEFVRGVKQYLEPRCPSCK